ncbi:chaperone protein DnaJ 49-like protein [Tanacetum coccineum]|uniref:Chaperone protein DnaJ 49-like protein n=1 Tax=Tanacetum coccineum TaxID=301880 RepID=A0ABQ5GSY5_9ASTR
MVRELRIAQALMILLKLPRMWELGPLFNSLFIHGAGIENSAGVDDPAKTTKLTSVTGPEFVNCDDKTKELNVGPTAHSLLNDWILKAKYPEPLCIESLLEANKDDAIKAQEIAITKANQELYLDGLKFARKAQRMNPELHKIKKLVASMEILSASSDTTHYKLLGVEETDDAIKIRSAYRKLAIDVHPDQNPFPKASEAFKRIVLASSVLSDEQSRAKFDHALAAARKTPHGGARNAAAREAATREAAAQESAAREAAARESAAREAAARESAAREAAARESAARETAAREAAAREAAREADALSGESFSTDTSSTDTSYTDASSTDDSSTDDSSTNASFTDDVGPGSKRASDAQATSTLHPPKKRRE